MRGLRRIKTDKVDCISHNLATYFIPLLGGDFVEYSLLHAGLKRRM